jgi:hypothetical protein
LQNPSDPDAGYDGHKGKGYQVQIAETYSNSEDKDNPELSLITHVDVEPSHASDANALLPYIEATRKKNRFRAGVEATMSQLDRRTGIKHLRMRGMEAVCFAATLKATALNILRAAAFRKRQNKGKTPGNLPFGSTIELIRIVKERFFTPMGKFIGGQGTILSRSCCSASN